MNFQDDPRITAYALGELPADQLQEVEAILAGDAEARAFVETIRKTAGRVQDALQDEMAKLPLTAIPRKRFWTPLRVGIAVGTAMAACVAVAVMLPSLNRAREVARVTPEPQIRSVEKNSSEAAAQKAMQFHSTLSTSASTPASPAHVAPPITAMPSRESALRARTATPSPMMFDANDSILLPTDDEGGPPAIAPANNADKLARINERINFYRQQGAENREKIQKLELQADELTKRMTGQFNTESYDRIQDNPFLDVVDNPLSTFSVDVDSASYSNVRRFLNMNQLPPKDAVRIEEMVNYFPYDYAPPTDGKPFATHMELSVCPWNEKHQLLRIAIKGQEIAQDKRPPSNLVFLLDVSGSMDDPRKLPLVKRSMKALLEKLGENDRVAIVVYAGSSGLVLSSTPATEKARIAQAIDELSPGGSTNGAQGVELAYAMAKDNFIKDGTNRVILCTDGDFNVGVTDQGSLTRLIEDKAKSGVFLSVLGFGMGNTKDSTMEKLADKGNGNYAYIDTFNEARKVLVEQMAGTLVTIAKDVKLQLEFNPAKVASYRLIGYENRMLAKEDFNNDMKDAGEIGAGHTVTALYELVPASEGSAGETSVDALKYQKPSEKVSSDEMLTLKLRFKPPTGDKSDLIEFVLRDSAKPFSQSSKEFQFASAVAGFGMILRDSPHKGSLTLDAVAEIAASSKGEDASGYRGEFVELVAKAKTLKK
jgi:Ca-activated chloride channel family protein